MTGNTPCDVEQVWNGFVDAEQYVNPVIANKSKSNTDCFRTLIPRGNFVYGQGYVKQSQTFYGGIAVQDSGSSWSQMQESRAPGTNGQDDEGYDACTVESEVVGHGMETKSYTIYQASRRTYDICLTDILFQWQFGKQLELTYNMLGDITLGEWEQITRELYLSFANTYFAKSGSTVFGLEEFDLGFLTANIDIPAGGLDGIGTLDQSMLDRIYSFISRQAPEGAMGKMSNMPQYGLITSMETSKELITEDSQAVTNFHYAQPNFLIEGYGGALAYKGYAHIINNEIPRFEVSDDGSQLERVYPLLKEATSIGDKVVVNPAYINAAFELSIVYLKDVYTAQVPQPNPSNPASGYNFDPTDNFGTFKFVNEYDRCENPYREKGFFRGRFRIAPEPGRHSGDAVAILHRRCNLIDISECDVCDSPGGAESDTNGTAITDVALVDSDDSDTRFYVTLSDVNCLDCGPGAVISLGDALDISGAGNNTTAVLADDWNAPTLEVVLANADDITVAQMDYIQCGDTTS